MAKKKTIKLKPIIVNDPIYRSTFICFKGWSGEDANTYLQKHYIKHDSIETHGFNGKTYIIEHDNGGRMYAIWIRDKDSKATLIHEIVHATWFLFRDRGIRLSDDSDEAFAYFIEFLFYKFS